MSEMSDLELLDALGVETTTEKKSTHTAKEERIIAGFEEIQRFVEEHGHLPRHGEDKDIFERIYAVRLDRIRQLQECRQILESLDHQGLLVNADKVEEPKAVYETDTELLKELGVDVPKEGDITHIKYVKTLAQKEREKAEEVGTRTPCKDFNTFKPMFDAVQEDLKSGRRKTLPFDKDGSIEKGNWFILSGQKAYVASIGDQFIGTDGRNEYRLRVIFDNGVESNQLMRSLQKRLWEDEAGRRITELDFGPLFSGELVEGDSASGTIYVLRSKLDHPVVNKSRDVIHKIGVTGGDVKSRIGNPKVDPTYLMADVEIIATYELYNINRVKLEALIHKFFDGARLDIQIQDRFGNPVVPREWFLVPLFVIDEVVERIKDKSISNFRYDPEKAALVKASNDLLDK